MIYLSITMGSVLILANSCKKDNVNPPANTISDINGNIYHTVTIGTQVWMVENLKVTKYNDGTAILLVTDNSGWANLTTGGYCWYSNDEATYKNTYGAIYNWYTLNTGKLCPAGWHVPTDAEWTTLTTYLGGEGVAGGKLKESGLAHWLSPNTGATNESGFTALPGGARADADGIFNRIGQDCYWWSSSQGIRSNVVRIRNVGFDSGGVIGGDANSGGFKTAGMSVRCIKD